MGVMGFIRSLNILLCKCITHARKNILAVSYIDEGDMLDAALAGLKRGIELKRSEAVAKKVARWRPL